MLSATVLPSPETASAMGANSSLMLNRDFESSGTSTAGPVKDLQDYSQWVHLVGAMLRGGFTPEEAGKIAGGNYMRIFRAAVG